MTNIVALNVQSHSKTKIRTDKSFSFAKSHHIAPLLAHEIAVAAHEYPIVFLKDNKADRFRMCAMLGLKTGQNLCVGEKGWRTSYIPAAIRAYPFAMMPHPDDASQRVLCIDEDSEWVNEEEGEAIFTESGERTEYIQKVGEFMLDLSHKQNATDEFVNDLVEYGLLEERALEIGNEHDGKITITGIHVINEKKFTELSDEVFLNLRKKGFIGAIYGVLMSLSRVNNLLNLAKEAGVTLKN